MPLELSRETPARPNVEKSKKRAAPGNVAFSVLSPGTNANGPKPGRLTGRVGFAQSLVITLIVVEVVVMVVAVGLILLVHRHTNRVNARELNNIKG